MQRLNICKLFRFFMEIARKKGGAGALTAGGTDWQR